MSYASIFARFAIALIVAFGGIIPSYADTTPMFRLMSGGVRASMSNTSPDGITISIPSSNRLMRHGIEGELPAPSLYGNNGAGTWSIKSGSIPEGTDIISSSGVIGGTPTTIGVSKGIVLAYEDSTGRKGESAPFSITVVPAPEVSYANALVAQGSRYTQAPTTENVIGSARYTLESGTLPSGVSVDPATGLLRGTPLQLGVWPGVVVRVTDSDGATDLSEPFEIEVVEGGIIEYESPIVAKRGEIVSIEPFVDEMREPILFEVADGVELPVGLSLDAATGVLSGSLTVLGSYEGLQVVAHDADGKPAASNLFDIEVVDFSFAYGVEPFQVNTPVVFDPIIVGGTEPYTFTLPEDVLLPPGLILDATNGRIEGSVADVGSWPGITILLEDGSGATIVSTPIDFTTVGAAIAYDDQLVAMGEPVGMEPLVMQMRAPIAFEVVDGELPDGVSIDEVTGVISGATVDAGDWPLMVQAMDVDETLVMSEPFMLSVGIPQLGSNSPDARGRVGLPFYHSLGIDGMVAPLSWESLGDQLPPGVDLDPSTGSLSGTPVEAGFFNGINLRATDANGTVVESGVFSIEVTEPALFYADPVVTSTSQSSAISPTSVEIEPEATFISAGAPLPEGLSINPFNGDIEGSPLENGLWTGLSVMVIEPQGYIFFSNEFSISVGGGTVSGITMPDYVARVGVSFATETPEVSGATGPFSWTVSSGVLPDGLVVDSQSGVISGVPEFPGVWPGIVVSATGPNGVTNSNAFTITVSALTVSVTDVYYGRVDRDFHVEFEASGGVGAMNWELIPNTPPDGIELWSNAGVLDGTPTTEGTYGEYRLRVTDSSGAEATSLPFLIIIEDELPPGDILIDVPSVIRARPGVDFWLRPDPEGAAGNVTWEVVGTLPPGLTINRATGRIDGKPTQIGLYDGLQFKATDTSGQTGVSPFFAIDVQQVPGVVVTPDVYEGQVGTPMSVIPTHDQQVFGSKEWRLIGRAPFGMRIDPLTGRLTGTPLEPGDFGPLQVKLTDADGAEGLSNTFTISIISDLKVEFPSNPAESGDVTQPGDPTTPTIPGEPGGGEPGAGVGTPGTPENPGTPPTVKLPGTTYTTREGVGFATPRPGVAGQGGSVHWEIAGGYLPPGMTLDASSGRIIGTPGASGTWSNIYLRLDDGSNVIVGGPINIVVLSDIVVTAPASVTGRMNRPLTFAPKASGIIGKAYWTFQNTGLPLGLGINSATGVVSITPSSDADISDVRFRATDSYDGAYGVSSGTSFLIHPDIVVGPPSVPMATAGLEFSMPAPSVSGIVGSARWSVIGSLPPGLSISTSTGEIAGTPLQRGTWPLRLRVTDTADNAFANSAAFNLVVQGEDPPVNPEDPNPPVNPVVVPLLINYQPGYTAYTDDPFTTGAPVVVGNNGPVTFSLAAGSTPLPSWATLNASTGAINGTPLVAGSWSGITISATDGTDVSTDSMTITARPFAVTAPEHVSGRVGQPMSFKGTAAIPKGAVTWRVEQGTLPAGLSMNAGTGVVSGTPTSAFASREIVLRATDSVGRTDVSETVTLAVSPTVVVPASYHGTMGTPFTTNTPSLVGTTGAVTWSLASGTLPSWASFDSATGRISGTPNAAGTIAGLSIKGIHTQSGLSAVSGLFSIEIVVPKLVISGGPSHVRERVGGNVSFPAPIVSGNVGAITWSLVKGTAPDWLNMASNGAVTATSSNPGSSGALALRATDGFTNAYAETPSFSVAFVANPVASIIANANGKAGTGMAVQPVGSNIIGKATWSLSSGTLPSGLSIDAATGRISGTPTNAAVGQWNGIVLRVTDSHDGRSATTGQLSISISPDLSVVGYQSQYVTHPDLPFTTSAPTLVNATGAVTWSIASGALPSGLSLNSATGVISGTGSQDGVFTVVVRGTDGVSGGAALSSNVQIRMTELTAVIGATHAGTVTKAFQATPTVVNAIGGTTWSLASGTLPSWATLNPTTGRITGTPTAEGTYSGLRLRVSDSTGITATTGTFAINVDRGFLVSMTPTSYSGRVGVPLTLGQPVAQNVTGSLTWAVQGALPAGMGLNPNTGVVSGTPTAAGSSSFELSVTDNGDGASGFTPTVTVTIEDVPQITVDTLYTGRMGADFLAAPTVIRANGSRTWSISSGSLPPGLVLSSSGGTISGSATQVGQRDGIALRVVDGQGASGYSQPFSIRIDPGITATIPTTSYAVRVNNALTTVAPSAGNVLGSLTWLVSGTTPAGMTLNPSTGVLSGAPTVAGTHTFRLQARDSRDNARALTEQISIQVHPAMVVTGGKSSYGTHVNIPLTTQAYGVAGARGTVTWSLASGSLPSWASLNPSTGVISGTPTSAGNVPSISLRATDSYDQSTAVGPSFSIIVLSRMLISDMATNYYARVGQPFSSAPPSASPVGGSLQWYMNTGSLPGWASLDPLTGVMSGTAPSAGNTMALRLGARDDYGADERSVEFNLNVRSAPTLTPSQLILKRRVGVAGNHIIFTTGSLSPNPIWSYAGTLPAGMMFDNTNGTISGVVAAGTTTGNYNLEVSVQDSVDNYSASEQVQIQVAPALMFTSAPPPTINVRGGGYVQLQPPTFSGNIGDITWSLTGSPGGGLTIHPTTGVISGILTSQGATVSYQIKDDWDSYQATSSAFRIAMSPPMSITGVSNINAHKGNALNSGTPLVNNAVGSVRWSLNAGTLPAGISVDPDNGRLVGTPQETGTFSGITLRATDSEDVYAISNSFAVVISDNIQIVPSGNFLPFIGKYTTLSFTASNAIGTPTWTISGYVPGMTTIMAGARTTASIAGTPDSGNHQFTVTVTDSYGGSTSQTFYIRPQPPSSRAFASGSTVFTPPAGVTRFNIYLIGGGSGGGSSSGTSGAITFKANVEITEPVVVTIGAGGLGAPRNAPGGDGQATTVKTQQGGDVLASAEGGEYGGYSSSQNFSTFVKSRTIDWGKPGVSGDGARSVLGSTSCNGTTSGHSTTFYEYGFGGRQGVSINGLAPSNPAVEPGKTGASGSGYGAAGGGGAQYYTRSPCTGDGPITYRNGSNGVQGYAIIEWGY